MKLDSEWKRIVKKAWSIRFMALAGLLTGLEVTLPFFSDAIPRGVFAGMSFLAVGGGFVARLIAQKEASE